MQKKPIRMDDLGGKPMIFGNTHIWVFPKMVGGFTPNVTPKVLVIFSRKTP